MSDQPQKKKGGKLFKIVIGFVLLIALVFGGAYVYGMTLPETVAVKKTTNVERWDIAVYDALVDIPAYPSWTSYIKEVKDYKKNADGTATWTYVFKQGGEMGMHMTIANKPRQVKIEVVGNSMFSGYWIYDLKEVGKDDNHVTEVTLTESATIANPLMRVGFMAMGHGGSILETNLAELKKKVESEKKPST